MSILSKNVGSYTDYYEITMAQAYFLSGRADAPACFDYFFRQNPFQGGYVIFAGIDDLLAVLQQFRFEDDDLKFLEDQGLNRAFLEYLKSFSFRGSIHAVREGEIVFPLEPLVRVEGNVIETQLIETVLLNLVNFESLIATKASRLKMAAGKRRVVDFGLRRAQGLGGIQASKAAMIGGVDATSNVYAALQYSLEVSGTQAHSWIQSFDDELSAFRKFAEIFPDRCVLLVDTYDTLRSGVPNAITVAKELEQSGHRLVGVRLDSGDLAYLSKRARRMLDDAGLSGVKIIASNQLDEYVIRSLLNQGAPIDGFGVGTRLVTGQDSPALDGVYKMSSFEGRPRLKFSENFSKITLPGAKKIIRFSDGDGGFAADGIALTDEDSIDRIHHPLFPEKASSMLKLKGDDLMMVVMDQGRQTYSSTVEESRTYAKERLSLLHPEHQRFENPHTYKVGISDRLLELKNQMTRDVQDRLA